MSADDPEARACPACRGTGQVISNLGGSPSQVTCPWCEGGGTFLADHDAQANAPTVEGASEAPT